MSKTIKCSACKVNLLKKSFKNHVINKAKNELWNKHFFNSKNTPHLDLIIKKESIKLCLNQNN